MSAYEDVVEQRKANLVKKVDRFATFADHAKERSEDHWKKSDLSFIPMGQPILMGHHSQRSHEKAIERSNIHSHKSIEEHKKAEKWQHRSETAEYRLTQMEESKPYMSNKIEEAEKDIRFWTRRLEKSDIFVKAYESGKLSDLLASACGFSPDNIESAKRDNERSKIEISQAKEKKEYWENKLKSIGGVFDVNSLKKGDIIKTTCGVFPVKSINEKTVTVLNWLPGIPTSRKNLPFACIEEKVQP